MWMLSLLPASHAGDLVRAAFRGDVPPDLTTYRIDQALDDVSATLAGSVRITWHNRTGAPVAELPLLLHANAAADWGEPAPSSLTVTGVDGGTFAVVRPTLVVVALAAPVPPGGTADLTVRYDGRLRTLDARSNDVFAQAMAQVGGLAGAGVSDYGLLAVGDGIVTSTGAFPIVAPFREGAFDTSRATRTGDVAYNEVAAFEVRTAVPAGTTVVTNLVDGPPERSGALDVTTSRGAMVREFGLVAGRDLVVASRPVGEVTVRSVYRPRDARAGQLVLDIASDSLRSLERRFGPYPWTELDVCEATLVGGAGGMELSSMVLVAGMLYRPPEQSQAPLASLMKLWGSLGAGLGGGSATPEPALDLSGMLDDGLEFTVAHEVAHQWFAMLVGNDSRREPAVDEPAAQYAASLAVGDRHGDDGREALVANAKLSFALYRMLGGPDRPARREVASFRTPLEYAGLVYGKAPYAYVALADRAGADRLHAAMRSALAAKRWKITTADGWVAALEAGGAPGAREVFRRWMDEAHGDADLQVDADGDWVIDQLFGPEVAAQLRQAAPALGLRPADLVRMVFGGALGDDAPLGPGIDPTRALQQLQGLP